MRYSTRTLLIGVLLVALLITGIGWLQWRSRWRDVSKELETWASSVDRTDGKIEQYSKIDAYIDQEDGSDGSRMLSVMTGEPVKVVLADGTTDWTMTPDCVEDPSLFFVIPPGVWVDNIDDVLTVWNRHYETSFQER